MGISAEVYGEYNKPGNFKARVIEKNEEQKAQIKTILMKSFMFKDLVESDLKTIIDAMEIKNYQ
jgi:cAMP-dependent protein kinase regulator